jgi:hypothetical protein
MKYLLLIYDNEAAMASVPQDKLAEIIAHYGQFTRSIIDSGNYKGGEQLQPTAKTTTVRMRDGKRLVTDGPFAETKEQLGGFYMIDAPDLDEAIAIAARVPSAAFGSIEVRPIVEMRPSGVTD